MSIQNFWGVFVGRRLRIYSLSRLIQSTDGLWVHLYVQWLDTITKSAGFLNFVMLFPCLSWLVSARFVAKYHRCWWTSWLHQPQTVIILGDICHVPVWSRKFLCLVHNPNLITIFTLDHPAFLCLKIIIRSFLHYLHYMLDGYTVTFCYIPWIPWWWNHQF